MNRNLQFYLTPFLLLLAISWWYLAAYRLLSIPFLIITIVFYLMHLKKKNYFKFFLIGYVAFLLTTIQPLDISLENYPGGYQFLPVITGLPTEEEMIKVSNGEVIPYGCVISGFEPKWVLVW